MSLASDAIAHNLASIMHAPQVVLPDGPARRWLFTRAVTGHDVYIYQAAGGYLWNVWLGGEPQGAQRLCLTPQGNEQESEFARWWADRFPGTPMVERRQGGAA